MQQYLHTSLALTVSCLFMLAPILSELQPGGHFIFQVAKAQSAAQPKRSAFSAGGFSRIHVFEYHLSTLSGRQS